METPPVSHDVPTADTVDNDTIIDVVGNKEDAANETANVSSLVGLLRQLLVELDVGVKDAATNANINDVLGNKEDARALTKDVASLLALTRIGAKEAWEAEKHVHSGERWLAAAATPSGETHIADRVGAGAAGAEASPLQVDAGNDDWGSWTQILGSSDTPLDSGSATHFDLHRLIIHDAEDTTQRYIVQMALQEDAPADDPGASDTYTEFELISAGVGANATTIPFDIQNPRVPAGTKVWMRTRAPNQNTSTIDFCIGIHEYTDPDV